MISRYSRKELVSIWSEENKYKIWLDVEIAAAQAMEKLKVIPTEETRVKNEFINLVYTFWVPHKWKYFHISCQKTQP